MQNIYHGNSRSWIDGEHRLLSFASGSPSDAEKELEAFEKSDVAPDVKGATTVDEENMSAKNRIKLIRERTLKERFVGGFNARDGWKKLTTWSQDGVYKEEIATKIEEIAQERLQKTSDDLQKSAVAAEKKLDNLAEKSKPSILLLRIQRDICDEITRDLQAEIAEKGALRDVYDRVGEILGENDDIRTSDLKVTKIPITETLQKKMDVVSTIKDDIEEKLDVSAEGKLTEQVAQLDGELRKLLALAGVVDIDVDQELYVCLTSRNRNKAVKDFVEKIHGHVLDPHILAACRTIVQRITGVDPGIRYWVRGGTEEKNAATAANFYRQQEMAKESLNDGGIAERLQCLASAPSLQRVEYLDGVVTHVLFKVLTNGNFIRLRNGSGNLLAVIDVDKKTLVGKDIVTKTMGSTVTLKEHDFIVADPLIKKSAIYLERA